MNFGGEHVWYTFYEIARMFVMVTLMSDFSVVFSCCKGYDEQVEPIFFSVNERVAEIFMVAQTESDSIFL